MDQETNDEELVISEENIEDWKEVIKRSLTRFDKPNENNRVYTSDSINPENIDTTIEPDNNIITITDIDGSNIVDYSDVMISGANITTSWGVDNSWSDALKIEENTVVVGDQSNEKHKIYIVEPWQSRHPIKVKDGLWVSLEHDLISNEEIKRQIMERLEEEHPDAVVKMGVNPKNVKIVKSEVTLEINKKG